MTLVLLVLQLIIIHNSGRLKTYKTVILRLVRRSHFKTRTNGEIISESSCYPGHRFSQDFGEIREEKRTIRDLENKGLKDPRLRGDDKKKGGTEAPEALCRQIPDTKSRQTKNPQTFLLT